MTNKEKNNSIRVVNLSGYEIPEVKEVYSKKWIAYGENNDYFDTLIERYLAHLLIVDVSMVLLIWCMVED